MVVIGDTLAALGDVPVLPAVGDTLWEVGASQALGEIQPGIWPNSGSRFPDGAGCGKCGPEYCSKKGCRFPDGAQPESVSRSGASKRDALSARAESLRPSRTPASLLAQDQLGEFVLGVHYVVGAGGLQLCAATEAPGDAGALEAGVVTGQDIDIGIAHIECGCRVGA